MRGLEEMRERDDVPLHLPLIDELLTVQSVRAKRPLTEWHILMIQHVLGSTVPLVLALEMAGAKRERLEIIGKAYSSSNIAVDFLASDGWRVRVASRGYSRETPYEESLRREIWESLTTITRIMGKDQRLLVLDEGGNAIELLHRNFAELLPQVSCVEQTSRGVSSLNGIDIQCPVVNVARSWAKSELEAPIIARGMLQALEHGLTDWEGVFVPKSKDVLVLGYGTIGRHVCHEFVERGFNVSVLDHDQQKVEEAIDSGYHAIRTLSEANWSLTGIIAGCTGGGSIGSEAAHYAEDRTLLVSMSSSDLEFQPWLLKHAEVIHERQRDNDKPGNPKGYPAPWRSLYRVGTHKGYLYMANGGFPIDFTGVLDPIPAKDIQLTRALMLTAALQVTESRCFGLVELDRAVQRWLAERFKQLQGNCSTK